MSNVFVMASDQNLVVPLGVAAASLGRVTPTGSRLVIFQQGIDPGEQAWVLAQVPAGLTVEFVTVTDSLVDGVALPAHLPPATLFRLVVGDLLPDDVQRVVYLDIDVLIREDPSPLFDAPVGVLAAARDVYRPWVGGRPLIPWSELEVDPATSYFNAGVLAIDLQAWRSADVANRCLELLRSHFLEYSDQDALNLVLAGEWDELDPRWNLQSDAFLSQSLGWVVSDRARLQAAVDDAAIVHFTGADKPWSSEPTTAYRREWQASLRLTSRPDWRPVGPSPLSARFSRVRRKLGRVVAGSVSEPTRARRALPRRSTR